MINPAENEIKKFSENYFETIISNASKTLKYNQCKDTSTVIEWFKCIPNKRNCRFIKFGVFEYCRSIFADSINFSKYFIDIEDSIITTIKHARKSLIFYGNRSWAKEDGDPLFDATMSSFDGAEVYELFGLYLLDSLPALRFL